MGKIKLIIFNPIDKEMEIRTGGNNKLVVGFTREIYFDLMLKIAMIQRTTPVGYAEIESILNELNKRAKGLSSLRRKEYGSLESPRSVENYWQTSFQNRGDRRYTMVKENLSQLSDSDIKDILSHLFVQKGKKEASTFELAGRYANIRLPKIVYKDKTMYVGPKESYLGTKRVVQFTCMVDIEDGLNREDIKINFLNKPIIQPPEIVQDRLKRLEKRKMELRAGTKPPEQIPWPGPTFSIESFWEDRSPIIEHPTFHLALRRTDYFTFLSVQDAIKNPIVKDENGRPQTLRERYLSDYSPFVPIPELAQSISGTVVLICYEGRKPYTLLTKRSSRVATGANVYVLAVNETPRRQPNPEEMRFLEDVPPERIKPDLDANGNPCIFQAIVRGAKEELGIHLPIESIKLLSFNLETDRYQHGFTGIADTDLTIDQIKTAFQEAKDKPFEYSDMFFVPFTPEDIYEFMRTHREWGTEAEIGLYQALVHKYGSERPQKLFRDYPNPIPGISPGV